MRNLPYLVVALVACAIAWPACAQQAQPTQNTQAPTSQNSPTSIGPDPFKAHDATASPKERVEEGAEPKLNDRDGAGTRKNAGVHQPNDPQAPATRYRCSDGKGGSEISAVKRAGCVLEPIKQD